MAVDATPRIASPRAAAAWVVDGVVRRGRSLDGLLPAGTDRNTALVRELSFGTVRWFYRLDAIARSLLRQPLKRKDGDVFALLLVGLYQLEYTRVPAHAAVAETVAAAADLGKSWAKGLLNAVLRRFQRERERTLAGIADDQEAQTAHPRWLLDALRDAWPQRWRDIVAANNVHPPMGLRVNRRLADRDAYVRRLEVAGIEAAPSPHSDCGVVLGRAVPVAELPGFDGGEVSVQDIAAQQAALLLDLAPGQRVLDACAAPGGKAGHILERQPALAELVALDADGARLERVRSNFERLGLSATLAHADAADAGRWWDGRPFDRILLDAPCTGTGVIRRHPDIKLLRRPRDVEALGAQQSRLLDALWPLLVPGGKLVYATCSVMPEENSRRVAQFLAAHDDARTLPLALSVGVEQEFGRQILPGMEGMDGFYYALVQKT